MATQYGYNGEVVRLKLKHLFLGVIIALVVVLILLMGLSMYLAEPPHLSDAKLIANFREHRAEFEQLRAMIIQDKGLERVDNNRTLPEDLQGIHVSSARIEEYRKLLIKLGIRGGIEASSDRRHISFISSYRGWVTHNSEKGYVYTEKPVEAEDIVEDLDQYIVEDLDQFLEHQVGSGARRIEGNWYLYFEGY